jgi:hypothetical protein
MRFVNCVAKHVADDETKVIGKLMGYSYVETCCGAAVDLLYREFSLVYGLQLLKDFSADPLEHRFDEIRTQMIESLKAATETIETGHC